MLKALKYPEIRNKIFFTLLTLIVFRLLAHIPVPGVDIAAIRAYLSSNAFFGFLDLFSGGGFTNFSIVTLGLAPYINVSIFIQLLTFAVPKLKELTKEPGGAEKINMYTKLISVPFAMIQAFGLYFLLSKQGLIGDFDILDLVMLLLTLTAGSMLLVWLGDLVTEYGIGNGTSVLIFVGILSSIPSTTLNFAQTFTLANAANLSIFLVLSLLVIWGVVLINEGTRNLTVEYGRRSRTTTKVTNNLPLKVNQVGVLPIIFAVSLVSVPSLLSAPLLAASVSWVRDIGWFLGANFGQQSVGYNVLYFFLVFAFTFFYTSIQFKPEDIADDLKKSGGFIPGIRPGSHTSAYIKGVVNKITLAGALFLGLIAVLPFIIQLGLGFSTFTVGGTGLLIVVSVILDVVRKVDSLMVTKSYDKFIS